MAIASVGIFLLAEVAFRSYYFGLESIYKPSDYSPRAITISKFIEADPNPLIGYKLSANQKGLFKGAPLSVNSQGFRGSEPAGNQLPPTYQISLLGASIDMGAGVSNESTYANALERQLNAALPFSIKIQNHAVGGYKAIQIEQSFWANVDKLEPNMILLPVHPMFFNKTYQPHQVDRGNSFCFEIRCHFQDFFILKLLTSYARELTLNLRKTQLFGTKNHWNSLAKKNSPFEKLNSSKEGDIFKRFIKNLRRAGYTVVVLRLPTLKTYSALEEAKMNNAWNKWLNEVNPPFTIDTSGDLKPKISSSDSIYPGDMHPNQTVHSLYANAILQPLSTILGKAVYNKKN